MIYPTGVLTAKDYANGMAGIMGHGDNELGEIEYMTQIVQRAMDQARAAGYAEAKVDAVKEMRTLPRTVIRFVHGPIEAIDLERAIGLVRALAPATTKEPT